MARAGVDDRILDTALDILRTRGPASVSIESVSAASGIAKTTIYRRFDNRESLLAATLTVAGRPVEIPDGLDMRETLGWVLGHARDTIEHVIGRGTLAAVVGDGDTSTRALLLSVIREAIGPFGPYSRVRTLSRRRR
jgi:AcrR family transcriptional regulator